VPVAQEGAETGFFTPTPTDRFTRNLDRSLAQQREEFGGFLSSSDFENARSRSSADAFADFEFEDARRRDAAAERQAQFLPISATLSAASAALPTALGRGAFDFGTGVRGTLEEQRRRPFDVFAQLAGLSNPQNIGFVQQGFNPVDPTSDFLGALAEAIPALLGTAVGGPAGGAAGAAFSSFI